MGSEGNDEDGGDSGTDDDRDGDVRNVDGGSRGDDDGVVEGILRTQEAVLVGTLALPIGQRSYEGERHDCLPLAKLVGSISDETIGVEDIAIPA